MSNLMVHTERFTRSRDPESSHDAGEQIGADQWTVLLRNVYSIIYDHGPLIQEEVVHLYRSRRLPEVTDQRIRSACSALEKGGAQDFDRVLKFTPAIRWTGGHRRTVRGRNARLFEVVR